MSQIFFYLSAILVGWLLHKGVGLIIQTIKNRNVNRNGTHPVTISEKHIQDCILPNNRGKSIDIIAKNLADNKIDPDFQIDFSI